MVGRGSMSHVVYLIDLGLAKCYKNPITGKHITYANNKKLAGTIRYASLNTHMGFEQSRRDDLECLGFTLVYMIKGGLPWQKIQASDKESRYNEIFKKKRITTIESLCKGLPEVFARLFYYCRSLKFEDKPDYTMLKTGFTELLYVKGYNKKLEYDWDTLKIDLDYLLGKNCNDSLSGENFFEKSKNIEIFMEKGRKEKTIDMRKSALCTGYTTRKNQVKGAVLEKRKQVFLVTKNIKKLRSGFLDTMRKQYKNDDNDEIPDEGLPSINRVRDFNFVKNTYHWQNFRNVYKKISAPLLNQRFVNKKSSNTKNL